MITNIDDILQVIRNMPQPEDPKEKQILTLIHKEDNLTDLLYQFVDAGYSPGVNFESGRITALKLELNKIFCIIQGPAISQIRDRRGDSGRHRGGLQQHECSHVHPNFQTFP